MADDAYLEKLLRDGKKAIGKSKDVALKAARAIRPLAKANAKSYAAISAAEARLGARIGKLLFKVCGNDASPDATFTLRFSDGRVAGYKYNGSLASAVLFFPVERRMALRVVWPHEDLAIAVLGVGVGVCPRCAFGPGQAPCVCRGADRAL